MLNPSSVYSTYDIEKGREFAVHPNRYLISTQVYTAQYKLKRTMAVWKKYQGI